jgi:hypothetical protein
MSDGVKGDGEQLKPGSVTVDDLFRDLTTVDAEAVAARLQRLGTDVMLAEGAGTLVDAVAYIRVVAREHGIPGSAAVQRMEDLAEALADQAAVWQQAADSAAISIRSTNKRRHTQA